MNTVEINIEHYFHALNTFLLGDIQVFNKNCELADKAKEYYHPSAETTLKTLIQNDPPPYSSIYPDPGSQVMAYYFENPNPRLTIPLTLTLFSAMELLGIFYTGKTNPGSTTANLKAFINKVPSDKRPTQDQVRILINIYRHGLAHRYFAKEQYSLSFSFLDPERLFFGQNDRCLNVNYLKQIFLAGFYAIQMDKENYSIMDANIKKMLMQKI
jgi:hypothetical protein